MAQMRIFALLFAAVLALGTGAHANDHDEDRVRFARPELNLIGQGRFVPDGILFAARGAGGWQGPVYLLPTRKLAEVRDENKVDFGRFLELLNTNVRQDITAQRFRNVPRVAQAARAGDYLVLVFPDSESLAQVAGRTGITYLADSYGKTYVVEGRPQLVDGTAPLAAVGPPLGEVAAKSRNTELAIIVSRY